MSAAGVFQGQDELGPGPDPLLLHGRRTYLQGRELLLVINKAFAENLVGLGFL